MKKTFINFALLFAALLPVLFYACKKHDNSTPEPLTNNDTLAKYYGMSLKHRQGVQPEYDSVTNTIYQHYINDSTYFPDTLMIIRQGQDSVLISGKVIAGRAFIAPIFQDSICSYYTPTTNYRNYQLLKFFNHYDSVSVFKYIYNGNSYYVQTSYSFDCKRQH